MNREDVLGSFESIRGKQALQHQEYDQIRQYLQGRYYDNFQDGSTLRDEPKYSTIDGTMQLTINLPYDTVTDNTALSAQMPQIDVPPKDDKSEAHSLKLQKILRATLEHSGGYSLMKDSAFYERAYGWSVMGALPNLEERRVDLVTYEPRHCYPVRKLGSNVFLSELYVSWKASPQSIKEQYPNYQGDPSSPFEDVDFLIYYGQNEKFVFAGGEFLAGVKHDWGFCPFVVIPCYQIPDGFGLGDVHQTVGQAIAIQKIDNLMYQYIYENVNADTAILSDDEFDPPTQRGKRTFWHFSKESKIEKMADTSGRMLEGFRMAAELQGQYGSSTGTNAARRGEKEGMYVSAGGQAALSQSLGDRIDSYLKVKAERMSLVFEYALRLYEKHFKETKLNLYGRVGKASFEVGFKGKDIKGYYRNNLMFLPAILNDAGNRIAQILQLKGSNLMSDYTAMNMIGIVDPEFEKGQWEEEQFEKAKLEGAMQRTVQEATMPVDGGAPQGGMVPQPPGADAVLDQKLQLEKGRTNETAEGLFGGGMSGASPMQPPAGMGMGGGVPGGQMPMPGMPPDAGGVPPELAGASAMLQPPEGGGSLVGIEGGQGLISLEEIVSVISAIGNLRGRVFVVGAAMTGNLADGEQLELMATNMLDKATTINALRKAFPELDGRITVHPTKGVPQEENREATATGMEAAV